jgi:7-cyano-7-deazaguanine synthase
MDSCVCAALAARDYAPAALHISYGQRTEERERQAFHAICQRLNIQEKLVVRNEALRAIGGSALTDESIAVPTTGHLDGGLEDGNLEDGNLNGGNPGKNKKDIPVTYVPFRNAHFLSVAVSWAEALDANKIFIGAVEQDSSGYPDCRTAYYQAFNQVIKAGTKEGTIEILTPLIHLRKSEIVRLGLELGAPFDLTWSCYSRQDEACGVCDSCILRLRAFAAAQASDPVPYAAIDTSLRS